MTLRHLQSAIAVVALILALIECRTREHDVTDERFPMSSTDSFDGLRLAQLFEQFRQPGLNETAALSLFGSRKEIRGAVWVLEPKAELAGIKAIRFRLEDIRRDKHLFDKIELDMSTPWKATAKRFSEVFSGPLDAIPPGPSATSARAIFVERKASSVLLHGIVELHLEPGSFHGKLEEHQELSVIKVVFRRFFPD